MNENKNINVIGAGFSGLTLSYFLNRAGFKVTVIEKKNVVGGLLQSPVTEEGLVEHAANGMVSTAELVQLCKETGIKVIYPSVVAKSKYIYFNGKKTKWPLGAMSSLTLIYKLLRFKLAKVKNAPHTGETLRAWGERVFNKTIVNNLIEPAFLGVYATTAESLSATLVTKNFFNQKPKKANPPKVKRETVSFLGGMQGFCEQMYVYLKNQGVSFQLSSEVTELPQTGANIVCTDPKSAAQLVLGVNPQLSQELSQLNFVSIAKVACFTKSLPSDGFGCLFPRVEKIKSLGVIFDSNLFSEQYPASKLQTWIVGQMNIENEKDLLDLVKTDMFSFWGQEIPLKLSNVKVWKNTLPCYDLKLEAFLKKHETLQPVFADTYLFANYCGDIGLSQIISRAQKLVERIAQ